MIKINGVSIPIPSTLQVGIIDISKGGRNAEGTLVIERIATKRKLELTWSHLSKEQLSDLLTRVSGVFFDVEYIDPQDNALKTGSFYCGDRSINTLDYLNEQIRYKDIKFNLIER